MLKILLSVGLGFTLFTYPEARQIKADLLRATAKARAKATGKRFRIVDGNGNRVDLVSS